MSRQSKKGFTDIPITIGFDQKAVVGYARISDQALKACPPNRFVLAPSYIVDRIKGINKDRAILVELSFTQNKNFIAHVEEQNENTDSEL